MKYKTILQNVTSGTGLIDHFIFRPMSARTIKLLRLNINPNIITWFALVYSIFAALMIVLGQAVLGVSLYFFFDYIDLIDGAIARTFKRGSVFGAFFDGFVDSVSEVIIILATGFFFNKVFLFFSLALFILLVKLSETRSKWITNSKEKQKSMFDYWSWNKLHILLALLATRNDSRKLIIILSIVFNLWWVLFGYFLGLYFLSTITTFNNLKNIKEA